MHRPARQHQRTLDLWEILSGSIAIAGVAFGITTSFVHIRGVQADGQLLIALVATLPAVLALQRRLIVEGLQTDIASRLSLHVLDNNASIWRAYREAIKDSPDRGILRLINGYHNHEDGVIVTGADDEAFFALLADRSRSAIASGGHLGVRLLLPSDVPGLDNHIAHKLAHFRDADVLGHLEVKVAPTIPPLDLLLNADDAVILDVPEVYGHPVQGTGFEMRSSRLHATLAAWYDENYWNTATPAEPAGPRDAVAGPTC